MITYEYAVVFDGSLSAAKVKSQRASLEKILTEVLSGKIVKVDDWGVKELAYPINKCSSGYFLIYHLELDASSAKQLVSATRLEEYVIRSLFVKANVEKKSNRELKKASAEEKVAEKTEDNGKES